MYMGAYGAASPKPTFLWAPSETVSWFSLPLPKKDWEAMVDKKTMPDGSIQVSGNKKLKGSQTYPKNLDYRQLGCGMRLQKGSSYP